MQLSSKHISLWYAALSSQPDVIRKDVTDALLRYAFDGIEPEFTDPVCGALFDALWSAGLVLPNEVIFMETRPGAPKGNQNAKRQPKKQFKTIQNNSGNCFNCFSDEEDKDCKKLNISDKNNSDNCFNCFSEEDTPLSSPSLSPEPPITPPIIPLTTNVVNARTCACEEGAESGDGSAPTNFPADEKVAPPPTPSRVSVADGGGSSASLLDRKKAKDDIAHITLWLTGDMERLREQLKRAGVSAEMLTGPRIRDSAAVLIREYYLQQVMSGKDDILRRGRQEIISHFSNWCLHYSRMSQGVGSKKPNDYVQRTNNPIRAGTGGIADPLDFARSFASGFASGHSSAGK